ncbi:carbohydrate porin [Telmatobacter bradus]|uniref:carbohydrate porin n=1 Tax=Telmatobacter bradus TaxID=474953 RepID=UPI003B4329C0
MKERYVRNGLLLFLIALSMSAVGQDGKSGAGTPSNIVSADQVARYVDLNQEPDDLRQELDADAIALSKIPSDPILKPDPFGIFLDPFERLTDRINQSAHLKIGETYTFVSQYATSTPDGVRHEQVSGRADFTGALKVYDHGSTAGMLSLLVRSGTNIGISQQFNLSDSLGSALTLNCLQGGGPQEPIMVNILYWRQDLLHKRLSLYLGKIHPNEYISLSMFNNDERAQFLNGSSDGNLTFASDGAYAGGAAVEYQATSHVYIHALTIDTEGSPQGNLKTLADRKYMQSIETGWFSGSPGKKFRDYRMNFWRDDTQSLGSGVGGGIGFEHELRSGWTPFGRLGFASDKGTSIKQVEELGLDQVKPFGRRGDMFGISVSHSEPTSGAKHHESVLESFYRLRLTKSVDLGPDLELSNHPSYAAKTYTTALLGMRMRIIF